MPTITILGQERGRSATTSGINDDGHVVGSEESARPFVWRPAAPNATVGTFVELGTLPEHPNAKGGATAINRQGDVVGFSETVNAAGAVVTRAVRWLSATRDPVPLGTLLGTGADGVFLGNSRAFAVNDLGQIAGVSDAPDGPRGFVFDPSVGGMLELPKPGIDPVAGASEALGINNFGEIVGSHRIHRGGRMVRLAYHWILSPPNPPLGQPLPGMGENDVARAINNVGTIVGDAQPGDAASPVATSVASLFRLSGDLTTVVDSRFSTALAVNDDGAIVGAEGQESPRAYRVISGQFEDLSALVDGLRIVRAAGINRRGQIAATATDGTRDFAVLITF